MRASSASDGSTWFFGRLSMRWVSYFGWATARSGKPAVKADGQVGLGRRVPAEAQQEATVAEDVNVALIESDLAAAIRAADKEAALDGMAIQRYRCMAAPRHQRR